jgi:predicted secreted protein
MDKNMEKAQNGRIILVIIMSLILSCCVGHTTGNSTNLPAGNRKIVKLIKQDNARDIVVKTGSVIEIQLKAAGGTGYEWNVTKIDNERLELISEDITGLSGSDMRVGTPVSNTWSFSALKRGVADLEIRLYRRWEGPAKSAETFNLRIRIED